METNLGLTIQYSIQCLYSENKSNVFVTISETLSKFCSYLSRFLESETPQNNSKSREITKVPRLLLIILFKR